MVASWDSIGAQLYRWSWDMLCLDPVQSSSVLSVFSLSLLADIQWPTSMMHSLSWVAAMVMFSQKQYKCSTNTTTSDSTVTSHDKMNVSLPRRWHCASSIIGNSTMKTYQGVKLTKAWTWWETNFWRFWLQFLPLPLRCIQLIKFIWIFAIFHHSAKHEDPRSIADKPISSTTRWRVTLCSRNKPLICSCAQQITSTTFLHNYTRSLAVAEKLHSAWCH